MGDRSPESHPIGDLVRDAKALIERVRARQEPVIITERDEAAAVLVPIELYREMERQRSPRLVSPRLSNPADAEHFRLDMSVIEVPEE